MRVKYYAFENVLHRVQFSIYHLANSQPGVARSDKRFYANETISGTLPETQFKTTEPLHVFYIYNSYSKYSNTINHPPGWHLTTYLQVPQPRKEADGTVSTSRD